MTVLKTALLGIVLFAQSGFALPALEMATQQLQSRIALAPHSARAAACVDFSGRWKGKCTANGASEDSTMEIVQKECEQLKVGNEVRYIGALDTHGQGIPLGDKGLMLGFVSTNDWNTTGTELITQFSGLIKVLGNRDTVPANGRAVTKLVDGKLVVEAQIFDIKVSCSYDKQ